MIRITSHLNTNSWRRLPACVLPALLLCSLLLQAACVTERRPISAPSPANPTSRAPEQKQQIRADTKPLVRQPENQRITSSHIVIGVQPLGRVPFDAQVLPLISPDGNFLATQTGDAPDWPTLLAEKGATPNLTTKIRIFDISQRPPREITPDQPLPLSLLLGRSTDDRGFLVESPRPNGSRSIGRVDWRTGKLTWLIQSARVNAFATWNTRGDLAWMSRAEDGPTKLHVRFTTGDEDEETQPANVTRVYPAFTNDPDTLYLLELTDAGIDAAARTITGSNLGPTIARRRVTTTPDPFLAYQSLASVASPVHAPDADSRFAFHNTARGRITLFDPVTSELTPAADRSIASAPIHDGAAPGLMLTTPKGLIYQRITENGELREPTRMLAEDHVPRATNSDRFPAILIAPADGEPTQLSLTRIFLPEDAP